MIVQWSDSMFPKLTKMVSQWRVREDASEQKASHCNVSSEGKELGLAFCHLIETQPFKHTFVCFIRLKIHTNSVVWKRATEENSIFAIAVNDEQLNPFNRNGKDARQRPPFKNWK